MEQYEKEHLKQLRLGLGECTVLLKKDGSFPLSSPGKIAAYGSGVRHTVKGGTGSGEVNSRSFVTVEEGLRQARFEITTGEWLDQYDEILKAAHGQFVRDIKKRARQNRRLAVLEGMGAVMPEPEYDLPLDAEGEAAIYVLSRICGEGNDRTVTRGDFLLTRTEIRDILALNQRFERFMLVINTGGPVDLAPVQEVGNILVLSQLGVETGKALADILLGRQYPSGKLTTTWAAADQYPDVGDFGEPDDTRYKEGIYVGYRWFEVAKKTAWYPFGYGLGYTEFSITEAKVSMEAGQPTVVNVSAKVTNVGSYWGKEVVQVYLSCPDGKLNKAEKELAAWRKTKDLTPGRSQTVEMSFDLSRFVSYDEESASYILEQGDYVVRIGNSSAETVPVAVIRLDRTVTLRQLQNKMGKPDFEDWKPEERKIEAAVLGEAEMPIFYLPASVFTTETAEYEAYEKIHPILKNVSDEELCLLHMGAFDPKGGIASIIGSASRSVPGAAGESCCDLREKGIPSMVMSDGPAGVRISPQYYEDEKGKHSYGPALPESILEFLPSFVRPFLGSDPKLPEGTPLQEQYCTAIPIGTALAQSWNLDFAEVCGDVVGREMEIFGIHLWLAPALNIHRSPLCGRNFEYFSEDPLLSGLFAAALTRGVQSHPGKGVTIKHFAANNQETNRYFSNSMVSERALREIYLKGFEICVREAAPKAIMTSYNLINGVHTSESRELCVDILRREWGFTGVCMTDWVVAGLVGMQKCKYGSPDPARVAAAGGELYMPGSKKDYAKLKKGLKKGIVTRKQLRINASRVYRMAVELAGKD